MQKRKNNTFFEEKRIRTFILKLLTPPNNETITQMPGFNRTLKFP